MGLAPAADLPREVPGEEPRVRVVGKGLAELLSGPCGRWVLRHIDMQDASPVVGQDNEAE